MTSAYQPQRYPGTTPDRIDDADPRDALDALRENLSTMMQRIATHEKRVRALLPDEKPAARKARLENELTVLAERFPDPSERPPLFGLVVGAKDLFRVDGYPTRAGSSLPPELFAGPESTVVTRLRNAGALILGKTVSTEFAYFGPGPTTNPLNSEHTPGGSSSGSAAAVAAGFCHAALGTQTIGSISRPATFCGVAGYKPSYGRISTEGVIPFSPDADHVGPIAPDVGTLTALAAVMVPDWSPAEPLPPSVSRAIGTVLVPDDAYVAQADKLSRSALEAVVERLTGMGVDVQRIEIFPDIAQINERHQQMIARDFAEVHAQWFSEYGDHYHPRSAELVKRGQDIRDEARETARSGRFELRARLDSALERHNATLWIAPATVGAAPHGIGATGDPIMNLPWTYSGVPTVSVPLLELPAGVSPEGLPVGIQIGGRFGGDEQLLARAALLESVLRGTAR